MAGRTDDPNGPGVHYRVVPINGKLIVEHWNGDANAWFQDTATTPQDLPNFVSAHPGQWEVWSDQGRQSIVMVDPPREEGGPGGRGTVVPGLAEFMSDVAPIIAPAPAAAPAGPAAATTPIDTGGGDLSGIDFSGGGGSGRAAAYVDPMQGELDAATIARLNAEAANYAPTLAETIRSNQAAEEQAKATLAAKQRGDLATSIANLFGTTVQAADSARQSATSVLNNTLPMAVSPEDAQRIGSMLNLGGPNAGQPITTTPVTVHTEAMAPSDVAKMMADAEAKSRAALGMHDGGVVTGLYHAQGGAATTNPDGSTTIQTDPNEARLKERAQFMADMKQYADLYGIVPQAVWDASLKYYGLDPIPQPPTLNAAAIVEDIRRWNQAEDDKNKNDAATLASRDADRRNEAAIAAGQEANALAIAQGHDTTALAQTRMTIGSNEGIAARSLAENARQFNLEFGEKQNEYLSQLAANPRRVIEAAYYQAGEKPTAAATQQQNAINSQQVNSVMNNPVNPPAAPVGPATNPAAPAVPVNPVRTTPAAPAPLPAAPVAPVNPPTTAPPSKPVIGAPAGPVPPVPPAPLPPVTHAVNLTGPEGQTVRASKFPTGAVSSASYNKAGEVVPAASPDAVTTKYFDASHKEIPSMADGGLVSAMEGAILRRAAKGKTVTGKGKGGRAAMKALLETMANRMPTAKPSTTPISGAMLPQPGPSNPMPSPTRPLGMVKGGRVAKARTETIPAKEGKPAVHFKKGALHEQLGVPAGEKIPASKMDKAASGAEGPLAKKRALFAKNFLHRSATGSIVKGPAIILVGEGKDGSGIKNGTHEYVRAPVGTVIAPGIKGETPTMETAMAALHRQMLKSRLPGAVKRAAKGATVTPDKARQILKDGTIRGKPITDKQRRFFGYQAGLKKAYTGYYPWVKNPTVATTGAPPPPSPTPPTTPSPTTPPAAPPPPVAPAVDPLTLIKTSITPGQLQATRGSAYDPLGGANANLRSLIPNVNALPTFAGLNNMSRTQRGLWEAGLSAGQLEPTDVEDYINRGFQGFGAGVGAGQTARVGRGF